MKKSDFEEQFCLLPWTSLEVGVSGNFAPCCKFQPYYGAKENDHSLKAQKIDFEQAWLSKAASSVRYDFASGKKPEQCNRCWDEEKAGIRSMRKAEFEYFPLKDLRTPEQLAKIESPLILDLKLGSACNLKCRICDPYHSTLWWNEYQEDQSMPRQDWFEKHENFMTDANWTILRKWLPNLRRLMIFGGEPLFQKDFFKVLDLCEEMDSAKHLSFLINTNSTIFDKRFADRFDKFEHIEIHHSIDDIGNRFEYQRHPANWKKTLDVLQRYSDAKTDNCRLVLYCTVSTFNVYYLPEYLKWAKENLPNHNIVLNLVHFPSRFNISNLPSKAKSAIAQRLKFINLKNSNLLYEENIRSIIDFMSKPWDEKEFNSGILEIKRADKFRRESFQQTFPEMHELLKEYF